MAQDTATLARFKSQISEKFCAIVGNVDGLFLGRCGSYRIERFNDGSIKLSQAAAKLLAGIIRSRIQAARQVNADRGE